MSMFDRLFCEVIPPEARELQTKGAPAQLLDTIIIKKYDHKLK